VNHEYDQKYLALSVDIVAVVMVTGTQGRGLLGDQRPQ